MNDIRDVFGIARALLKDRKGVTALEYGLIAAFISAVLIAVVPSLASGLRTTLTRIADNLT